jgi:hypothetical protein
MNFKFESAIVKTAFVLTRKNFGFTYMVGGTAVIGHAGSIELTRTSTAYNFFGGKTSFQVWRNLNI